MKSLEASVLPLVMLPRSLCRVAMRRNFWCLAEHEAHAVDNDLGDIETLDAAEELERGQRVVHRRYARAGVATGPGATAETARVGGATAAAGLAAAAAVAATERRGVRQWRGRRRGREVVMVAAARAEAATAEVTTAATT